MGKIVNVIIMAGIDYNFTKTTCRVENASKIQECERRLARIAKLPISKYHREHLAMSRALGKIAWCGQWQKPSDKTVSRIVTAT